ncbi:type I pantothenate kinase [Roseomonas sp. GCM10028921]
MDGKCASRGAEEFGPYRVFGRHEWAALRSSTPLPLTAVDVATLRGVSAHVSLAEVADVLLPLSRLLNLHVAAARNLAMVQDTFLGRPARVLPYVIAIAGSVAIGKSTFARLLQAVLARWPDHPRVQLVTTDGFLHPTRVLLERGLMKRKGFPESYDLRRMIAFLRAVKAGEPEVLAPVYSHLAYDIMPDQYEAIRQPDILIFEGLNVLQTPGTATVAASDFFDFSVYMDAEEADIESWYVERFLVLQRTTFQDPNSYFHHYRDLSHEKAVRTACGIWREINGPNLRENIQPTRPRARLVLTKGADHAVREVALRRM